MSETVRDIVDQEGEDGGGVFVADEIASVEERKAASAEAADIREDEEDYDYGTSLSDGWRRQRPT